MKLLKITVVLIILILPFKLFSYERFAIPYFPGKDLTKSDKTIRVQNIDVNVAMSRPAKIFKKIYFEFSFYRDRNPIKVEKVFVKFNMKMDMGKYYFKPKCDNNICRTEIILPKCIWGDNRWFGKLMFQYKNKDYKLVFFFDITD